MHISQDWVTLAAKIEDERQDKPDQETPDKTVVNGTRSEHTLGTERTPQDGSGKERVYTWASEPILLMRITDHLDVREHPGLYTKLNCTRDSSCDNLTEEHWPRRDLGRVC